MTDFKIELSGYFACATPYPLHTHSISTACSYGGTPMKVRSKPIDFTFQYNFNTKFNLL